MTDTLYADVSEFQVDVDGSYPYQFIAIRSNDGTYTDHHFAYNLAWAKHQSDLGKLAGFMVYLVWESDPTSDLATARSLIGPPHPKMALMLDIESWAGRYTGDHSASINAEREAAIHWLGGNRKRVVGYGNPGDLTGLWPERGDANIVLADYATNAPFPNKIAHQFADNFVVPPFGPCDANSADGLSPAQFVEVLGIGSAAPVTGHDRLVVGQSLAVGRSLTAADGSHYLDLQSDGNLVLYNTKASKALWSSKTNGKAAHSLNMQSDGNVVLYDATGKPLWQTKTNGSGADRIVCQIDGNLVVYAGSTPVWQTKTGGK